MYRDRTRKLLSHYFSLVWNKAGLNFDSDCFTEMEELTDCIFNGVKDELRTDRNELIDNLIISYSRELDELKKAQMYDKLDRSDLITEFIEHLKNLKVN